MAHVKRFDHVGITVEDLDLVTDFFVRLGLEPSGRTSVEGEFLDTVCGIPDSRTEIVGLQVPGGGTWIELGRFVRPDHVPGSPDAMANELGLRNVCFVVDDLQATVDELMDTLRFDCVFAYSSPMAEYLFRSRHWNGSLQRMRRMMDLIDVDSAKWQDYAERSSGWRARIYAREARLLAELAG